MIRSHVSRLSPPQGAAAAHIYIYMCRIACLRRNPCRHVVCSTVYIHHGIHGLRVQHAFLGLGAQ
jgi:hypothetical protein